jgi:hypothetical protein
MSDLLESVDWSGVECLNAKPDHGLDRALKQVRASLRRSWRARLPRQRLAPLVRP